MTFSIVARCSRTGELGVAVSTAVPAVGAMCPWLSPGVGAVSTQSWVNPYLAQRILARLASGDGADEALLQVLKTDPAADLRQVGVVDRKGRSAVWTGKSCTDWAGDFHGEGFTVQGNMLTSHNTVDAMARAFEENPDKTLAQRLMLALEAGQAVGGDKRGRQSAALKVMGSEIYALFDVRVDDHPDPVAELRRVFDVAEQQFSPFIAGMPTADDPGRVPEPAVMDMLLASPDKRPGASLPGGQGVYADDAVLSRWLGTGFAKDRVEHNLDVYREIVDEISLLRKIDLADLSPVVICDPLRGRQTSVSRGEKND
jgi:uncharacterized Ntn-hydrolase superfamily protein